MTEHELLDKVTDPNNWTDAFLQEADNLIISNWNRIRAKLASLGLYGAFDRAYCEWKKPGQIDLVLPAAGTEKEKKKSLTTVENGVIKPVSKIKPFDAISAKELQGLDIPPLEFVVNNLLPVGLAVLGAPPKSFKSYMCLDMCLCVSQGLILWGLRLRSADVCI